MSSRTHAVSPKTAAQSGRHAYSVAAPQVACGWAGLGSVGCGGASCVVYIKGAYTRSLTVSMHELAHTQAIAGARELAAVGELILS